MIRTDFDLDAPLNYSIISVMPSEVYKIKKQFFLNFIKDRTLLNYKSSLATLNPDWIIRKCYIKNQQWRVFKHGYI